MKRLLITFMLLAGASTALRAQNMNSTNFHYLLSLFIFHLRSIFSTEKIILFNSGKCSLSMTFSGKCIPIDIIETILFPP